MPKLHLKKKKKKKNIKKKKNKHADFSKGSFKFKKFSKF